MRRCAESAVRSASFCGLGGMGGAGGRADEGSCCEGSVTSSGDVRRSSDGGGGLGAAGAGAGAGADVTGAGNWS